MAGAGTDKHVLVVDDEPDMLELLGAVIATSFPNVRLTMASNGFKALEHVQNDAVDVLITDYRMPGLDGLELAKQVRGKHPALPVVLMTAFADDSLRSDAFVSRVNVFIKKPVDPAELVEEVRRLLDSRPRGGAPATR